MVVRGHGLLKEGDAGGLGMGEPHGGQCCGREAMTSAGVDQREGTPEL